MVFLVHIHPLNFYLFGHAPRLSQTSGMTSLRISMGGVGSFAVVAHSEREEACKLEVLD